MDEHEDNGHAHEDTVAAPEGMAVTISATPDAVSGVNVHIDATRFTFTPEDVNLEHMPGAGHAHIYLDGAKLGRIYGPDTHIDGVPPGEHEVRVTLNANTHAAYAIGDEMVVATVSLQVPEHGELPHGHDDGPVKAPEGMSVSIEVTPDAVSGANLRIDATGFTFSPEAVNGEHAAGEGHAHVYIDGEKVGRAYGPELHLGLEPGEHEIRVSLQTNLHAAYVDADGQPIETVATVVAP